MHYKPRSSRNSFKVFSYVFSNVRLRFYLSLRRTEEAMLSLEHSRPTIGVTYPESATINVINDLYPRIISNPLDTKVKKNLRSGGAFLFFFLLYKADPSFFALYKAKAKISGRLRYKKYRSAYFPKIAPPLPGPPPLFPLFFFCRGCSFFL